jgi:hypothetical protein
VNHPGEKAFSQKEENGKEEKSIGSILKGVFSSIIVEEE